jgi:hypothetical protein
MFIIRGFLKMPDFEKVTLDLMENQANDWFFQEVFSKLGILEIPYKTIPHKERSCRKNL